MSEEHPTTDAEFHELVDGVFSPDELITGSPNDVLHMHFALSQALDFLDAGHIIEELRTEVPWFTKMWDEPEQWWHELRGEGGEDELRAAVDRLSEYVKLASEKLSAWLRSVGRPNTHLWTFMPCHIGWAHLRFYEEKAPELKVF